jgi:type VI secretion system protein ImpF
LADLTLKERLQPSLLDRLTDKEPETNRESRDRRVISENSLRECVIRDLGSLLNTAHFAASEDLEDYPEVGKSVLNYGIPDLAGVVASSMDVKSIEEKLRESIIRYEPRIISDTLKIRVEIDGDAANQSAVSFRIDAELWAQPVPLNMFLRTEVDLETGNFSIVETGR